MAPSNKRIEYDAIWQDRDIRFDLDASHLRSRSGEIQIEKIDNVEDTKGNNGERVSNPLKPHRFVHDTITGVLRVTNIRLIWHSMANTRVNLSIGYNAINGVTTKTANSKLRGTTESLYLMARNQTTRFEFIFTCMNPSNTKLFTTVIAVHRAYETSKLYRELKMRGSIIDDDRLKLLPAEEQFNRIEGVWNLSSDQGNLGFFVLTNVRLVWYAAMNAHFNVSIPYLQLRSCRIRDSKFGPALVIETSQQSGDYVLGFRVDPSDRLEQVTKEVQSLRRAFQSKPIFGVQFVKERPPSPSLEQPLVAPDDDVEIEHQSRPDAFAAYFAGGGGGKQQSRGPVYSEELGMAIEKLKDGFTLKDLWEIKVD